MGASLSVDRTASSMRISPKDSIDELQILSL